MYAYVQLDGSTQTSSYFAWTRIRPVPETAIAAAPPVARVFRPVQERPDDQERPQTEVTLQSVLTELELLKNLLVKVENDLRSLTLHD